jgi:endonuclease-3
LSFILDKTMLWNKETAKKIYEILKKEYKIEIEDYVSLWAYVTYKDPFKVLIATILSQSSTDKAALKSFKRLNEKIGIEPENLAKASIDDIREAIKESGLQNQKAIAIKEIAKRLRGINLKELLEKDLKNAREKLMELPKIGYKTADVVLATFNKNILPVDTHVERVSKRLGIVRKEAKYEEIRKALEEIFPQETWRDIHLLFIAHGRKICKAKNPLCNSCKLFEYCEYPKAQIRV